MATLLLAGLLALQTPAAPPRDAAARPTETYTIRGRVTDVTTGQPIRGAAVSLRAADEEQFQAQGTLTDDQGRWGFSGLPAGDYILNHGKPGFTRVQGVRIYSPVHVSAQSPVRDIELVLARGGVITGRVTDAIGEPAVGVQVQAHRVWQGQVTWAAQQDTTDDRGEFRLFGLVPGEYALSATPQRHHGVAPLSQPGVSAVQTYYPGTLRAAEAERLVVVEQGMLADLTFPLQAARTFVISGEVITSSREVEHVNVSLNQEGPGYGVSRGSSMDEWSRGLDRFKITDVLPGEYTVSAHVRLDDGEEYGEVPVVVGEEDMTVTITTQAPTTVRGRVITRSGLARDVEGLQIGASSVTPERRAYGNPGRVRRNGTFELTTSAASFRLHVFGRTSPTGWRLKEVRWRGERVGRDGITPTAPIVDGIEVVVVESASRLQGTARDVTGAPMRQGTVVIVPADADGEFPIWHRANISDGRFVSPLIPEGRYFVAAVSVISPGEVTPAVVAQVRDRGESVEVGDREIRTFVVSVVIDAQ